MDPKPIKDKSGINGWIKNGSEIPTVLDQDWMDQRRMQDRSGINGWINPVAGISKPINKSQKKWTQKGTIEFATLQ